MRIWITFTAIVILLFCVPGLLLALPVPGIATLAVYLPLIALAVHDLYYVRVARTDPAHGFRRLAFSQFVLGIFVAGLLLQMGRIINDPATWQQLHEQVVHITRTYPMPGGTNLRNVPDAEWDRVLLETRRIAVALPLVFAALSVLSQTVFSWMLLRRARKCREVAT